MSEAKDDNNFLVYMYMRKDGTPYYVGKGRPKRPYTKGGRPCGTPSKDRIVIYRDNLDEETAFNLERKLIQKYGRKDLGTGILHNRTYGGEGASGRVISRETLEKMSGPNKSNYTPRDWYHPIHGVYLQKSVADIIKLFPDQNLSQGSLSEVANNSRIQHKGWKTAENKDLEYKPKSKRRDWYHPDYGEVLNTSVPDLIDRFKEQNLLQSGLSRVTRGLVIHHRKWRLLKNKNLKRGDKQRISKNWYHPDFGELLNISIVELVEMFPEQKLSRSLLSEVSNGNRIHHKEWRSFENKDLVYVRPRGKLWDWSHPGHGEILQISISELIEIFPDDNLSQSRLSKVTRGEQKFHKDWTLITKSVES
jgi:hypothetical protein